MQSRYVNGLTIRALRTGTRRPCPPCSRASATAPASAASAARSRGCPTSSSHLARVDRDHHVLVGYLDGDPEPVGIARLVRDGASAEIAFAVADAHQSRGIGSILASELAADARAAGITQLSATVAETTRASSRS